MRHVCVHCMYVCIARLYRALRMIKLVAPSLHKYCTSALYSRLIDDAVPSVPHVAKQMSTADAALAPSQDELRQVTLPPPGTMRDAAPSHAQSAQPRRPSPKCIGLSHTYIRHHIFISPAAPSAPSLHTHMCTCTCAWPTKPHSAVPLCAIALGRRSTSPLVRKTISTRSPPRSGSARLSRSWTQSHLLSSRGCRLQCSTHLLTAANTTRADSALSSARRGG